MNHADHVSLLRPGIPRSAGVWANVGSGTGASTLALADIIGTRLLATVPSSFLREFYSALSFASAPGTLDTADE